MKKHNLKRIGSVILAAAMLVAVLPMAVLAADGDGWYTDVAANADYYRAVKYLTDNGIVEGNDGLYDPDAGITRAQAFTILWRLEGKPAASAPAAFDDVAADAWYAEPIAWAAEEGYVHGYGDGNVGPNDVLTGADANTVLENYFGIPGRAGAEVEALTRADFAVATYQAVKDVEGYSLDISAYDGQWIYIDELQASMRGELLWNEDGTPQMEPIPATYALMNVVYAENPEDPAVQQMDIYVPADYVIATPNGDGTYAVEWDYTAKITSGTGAVYTAATAPVIYQNTVDGYKQGNSFVLSSARNGTGKYYDFLNSGYILISIGTRGLGGDTEDGSAPVQVVDLKAGIRYLRKNAGSLPGDLDKIVASGTSAGGSVTAIIGASGNSPLYNAYLADIGAVTDQDDDIFGALVFCPITNLDYADAAYEWLHASEYEAGAGFGGGMMGGPGGGPGGMGGPGGGPGGMGGPGGSEEAEKTPFTEFQTALHDALVARYKENLVSFGLDADAFETAFLKTINDSIAGYTAGMSEEEIAAFLEANDFLVAHEDGAIITPSIGAYVEAKMSRSNTPTAFDGLENNKTENDLFHNKHFSAETLAVLESLAGEYEEAAAYAAAYAADIDEAQLALVKIMSPMTFILGEEESTIAPHWRINNGGTDGNLGYVSGVTIVETLKAKGIDENAVFNLIWDKGHMAADYSYADVEAWIDSICK